MLLCVVFLLKLIIIILTTMSLSNCLEYDRFIDDDRLSHKNRHPRHDLPKTCRVSKSICPVWIRPNENFLTHPRKSFRVNKFWSNKLNKHNSATKRRRLERITWRRFIIKQSNKSKQTSMNTQPAPSPRPYTNLWWNKIFMSGLDTSHRQFSNTF